MTTPFADFRSVVAGLAPRVAVVFGSGLAGAADSHFTPTATIPYADVPGLVPPTVAGHGGKLAVGHWAGVPAVVCFGRVHFYEGHPWDRVTALVRLIAEFGVTTLLLTNAAGGIRDDLSPGDLMPIGGHLKLLGPEEWREFLRPHPPAPSRPSRRACPAGWDDSAARRGGVQEGNAFAQPLTEPHTETETEPPRRVEHPLSGTGRGPGGGVSHLNPWHHLSALTTATGKPAGIYAALTGPCYETPAEIRALRAIGADAVGMSTAVEAEAAVALGLTVAGVSCITNKAAGLAAGTLSHHEVEAVAKQAVGRLGQALTAVISA